MGETDVATELAALRVAEMRRYGEANAPPFDLASRDRVCSLLEAIGRERMESQRALLWRLLRHSSLEIVLAAVRALTQLGEVFDMNVVGHGDLRPLVRALLLDLGSSEVFNRLAPFFEPSHPRSAEIVHAALYALFDDFAWSNAEARLVPIRGFAAADARWIELARTTERAIAERQKGKRATTNADHADRDLRRMLRDLIRAAR